MRQDFRLALRTVLRQPLFVAVSTLTIALGIAAATTVYSVVAAVLLDPLPYEDPGRLVMVWEHNVPRDNRENVASPANYYIWRDQENLFQDLAGMFGGSATVTDGGEPMRAGMMVVTAPFFRLLGARAQLGRVFMDEEDVDGGPAVIVLSHGFWQRRFGGDPGILGRQVTINGQPNEVIGVMPADFEFDLPITFDQEGPVDFYTLFQFSEADARTAGGRYLQVLARLAPGVTLEAARARMDALAARLARDEPDRQAAWRINIVPLQEQVVGGVRRTLLVIFGAVAFVLLIACANVAGLLLARATDREQEMAVRAALGAGRWRVVRQLMSESLVLATLGGIAGVLLSFWAVRGLLALGPEIPRLGTIAVDGPVLLFALGVTAITGILFGIAPALRLSRPDLRASLGERGRHGSRDGRRVHSALVIGQLALSLILLAGAGLMLRSFERLLDTSLGFDPSNVLVGQISLPGVRYPAEDIAVRARFFDDLVIRVQRIPGVQRAGAITFPPLTGLGSATSIWPNDKPIPPAGELPSAEVRWVQRDYFAALGLPLLAGRTFDERDRPDAPLRIVVGRTTADELWPGQDPIGKTISMPWGDTLIAEVIGVVGDVRLHGPQSEARATLYWDHHQFQSFQHMSLVVRTAGDPLDIVPAVRAELAALDPELPFYRVTTMERLLADAIARTRFAMLALGLFAAVALVLAAVGIYGVMAYAVGRRAREIGVRIALGAQHGQVVGMVLRQGVVLVVVALVLGTIGALALGDVLENMVFGIGTSDPVTLAAVAALLAGAALLACWLPARRAARIDPLEAMRQE